MTTFFWWLVSVRRFFMVHPCLELSNDSIQRACRASFPDSDRPSGPRERRWGGFAWYRAVHAAPRALRACIVRCRARTTSFLLIAMILGPWSLPRRAQGQDGLISPARAIELFNEAEAALEGWDASRAPLDPAAHGARVVLRGSGMILGRGQSVADDGSCVRRALAAALRDAEESLGVAPGSQPQDRMARIGQSLSLSLEIAGPWTPFVPEHLHDASLEISPGLEGVAARLGERTDAVFPSTLLAIGGSPAGALRSLVASLSGDAGNALLPAAHLRDELGFVFYRFEVRHMAQASPNAGPVFLTRGGRVVPTSEITTRTLERLAVSISDYLVRQSHPDAPGRTMAHEYHPPSNRADEREASPPQRAVAALALARFARCDWGDPDARGRAQATADALMLHLGDEHRARAIAQDLTTASLVLLAHDAGAGGEDQRVAQMVADARSLLRASLLTEGSVPDAIRGLVACALSTLDDTGDDRERIRAFITDAFARTEPAMLVSQMPWLGWAQLRIDDGREQVASAVALRQMRRLIQTHQLQYRDTGEEARDLIGGIVFTASRTPLPTWHTTRAAAICATMLGDERLTLPSERPQEIASIVRTMRFIRQLACDASCGMLYPDPDRAMGGVRLALWDQTVTPESSAMALLAVVECVQSLHAIAGDRGADQMP